MIGISFIFSAVTMTLELVGSRVLAPYLGTSTFVWTSLIGVILASLSLGYWLGGKIADKNPSINTLVKILTMATVCIFLIYLLSNIIPPIMSTAGILVGTLLATIFLFAPATMFLGMINPLVVKLLLFDLKHSGETIGTLYAYSNIGSILGTFLGGFFLISHFGTKDILLLLAGLSAIITLIVWYVGGKNKLIFPAILVIATAGSIMIGTTGIRLSPGIKILADTDTNYSRVWIYEYQNFKQRHIRVLTNSIHGTQSAMFLDDPNEIALEYLKSYDIAEAINPNYKTSLLIGGSTYNYPRSLLSRYPNKTMDVIEIDPEVTELAKKYFELGDLENLKIIHDDGRVFLNKNKKAYGAIFVDAFSSNASIPFQLTTKENAQNIEKSLTEDGVVAINIISPIGGKEGQFASAMVSTYKSVFPFVYLYRVNMIAAKHLPQNLTLIASKHKVNFDEPGLTKYKNNISLLDEGGLVLTDDFAPIEHLVAKEF